MRLKTNIVLSARPHGELAVLFRKTVQELAAAKPGTPAQRAAFAGLQSISTALRTAPGK